MSLRLDPEVVLLTIDSGEEPPQCIENVPPPPIIRSKQA